ncbi:MAG: rhomboid family intramembrane serine protease [Firmicutes bacterium]|jgi:membrane associated rhomboid family serine protease|nr:rhomboid family intramembrane serine protease [Bacillota bacterium]
MIPIRDTAARRGFPLITILLIVANVLVFLYQQMLSPEQIYEFIYTYGTVPAELTAGIAQFFRSGFKLPLLLPAALPLVTANFLHGGWLHLIGNMIYLWIFGDNVEDRLGHLSFLVTYLLMGAGSQLFHVFTAPEGQIPLVGASGAIAGVLGAYFVLFPRARVLTLLPLGFFITFVHIPAVVFLAFWFILQLINATAQGLAMGVQPVAWWAHVGGFLIGIIVGVVKRRERLRYYRE